MIMSNIRIFLNFLSVIASIILVLSYYKVAKKSITLSKGFVKIALGLFIAIFLHSLSELLELLGFIDVESLMIIMPILVIIGGLLIIIGAFEIYHNVSFPINDAIIKVKNLKNNGNKKLELKKNNNEIGIFLTIIESHINKLNEIYNKNILNQKEIKNKVHSLENARTATINILEDMKEINDHLKDLDKSKSNFLNIVSHELKTPLTAIFAYLDILDDLKSNLNEDEMKAFDAIKRNSDQLKRLINNILEISRIEAGKFELINTKINPSEKIKFVVENLKPLAENKGIKLLASIDNKTPVITSDEQRLDETLNNLISNAIKFTDKGSVTVSVKKDGEFVLFSVKDTGVGIPKEKQKEMFGKFYQVDSSISRKFEGTGLGLSITKQLIELQGGKIWFESKEKNGTIFYFTLPIKAVIGKKNLDAIQSSKSNSVNNEIEKLDNIFSNSKREVKGGYKK